jgi:hypothetical protein
MFKNYTIPFLYSYVSVQSVQAQEGLSLGFGTGSSLLKFEGNYGISEKFILGGFYSLGISSYTPHYFGATGRFQFEKSKMRNGSLGAYVGGSMGYMILTGYDKERSIGGSVFIGTERFLGRKERVSTFQELHGGYMPNVLAHALKGLFTALKGEGDSDPSRNAYWGFSFGLRFYIGS